MLANRAACDCFSERPRATIAAPPRLARNSGSDRRKLFWPRSALIVAAFAAFVRPGRGGCARQGERAIAKGVIEVPAFRRGDMSQGSEGAAPAPRSHGLIRSPRDFWGGIALMLLALFAVWACG